MYLKSINNKQIYLFSVRFVIKFLILILIIFTGIYCFFESSVRQNQSMEKDVLAYQTTVNKQYILKSKVDTVYYHMSLLSTGKVENDLVLQQYITEDILELKTLIGEDKEGNFKCYSLLFSELDSLLILKNKIIEVNNQENLAARDLNECMGRFKSVYTELTDDPSRKSNKK
ncbi:type VI secretion system TssO [Myroides odoratus]|uniref:type VI secretion system TssO n=1 Tax=Myroides odoratus TaxID=256 RepID=UPI0039AFF5BA